MNVLIGLELDDDVQQTHAREITENFPVPGSNISSRDTSLRIQGMQVGGSMATTHHPDVGPQQPQPSQLCNAALSITDRIESVVENILDALIHDDLPAIHFAPEAGIASQSQGSLAIAPSQIGLSSQGTQDYGSSDLKSQLTQVATSRSDRGKALTVDLKNQQVTDRFCRALVLLDAVHV
jgi:hypothetical protein